MVDNTLESTALGVNEEGAIVVHLGGGSSNVVGHLPADYYPVDTESKGLVLRLPQDIHTEATPIFNGISFDTSPTSVAGEGVLSWDEEYQTLALQTGVPGVVLQVGQENQILCRNSTGGVLTSGDVVYISGSDGEYPTIEKAIASSAVQANSTIGMLTSSSSDEDLCMVTVLGIVHDLDTGSYSPGTVLYLSGTTAGGFTSTKVTTEQTSVRLGWVIKQSSTAGEVFVSVQTEMNSLGSYLDAQVRTASVSVPISPTVFVWDTEVTDNLSEYDPATGIITLKFSGTYSFNFLYNAFTSGSSKQLYTAAQVYSGGEWVPLEYSTRQLTVAQGIKALSTFVSTNPFEAGTQIRFVTWASETGVTIVTESPATGYTISAARILITGVKTV